MSKQAAKQRMKLAIDEMEEANRLVKTEEPRERDPEYDGENLVLSDREVK